MNKYLKPLIQWAGGKTQILEEIKKRIPKKYNDYYEPFIGGGALLFELQPKTAFINDINYDLINLYLTIKNNVIELEKLIEEFINKYNNSNEKKQLYLLWRTEYNTIKNNILRKSALFIIINRLCFNGLYRVNGKGEFNVSWNKHTKITIQYKKLLYAMSEYFINNNINIYNKDFETIIKNAKKGDFIFLDPPYDNLQDNKESFVRYTKEKFNKKEQIRLANIAIQLHKKGVYLILTNYNTNFINNLYKKYFNIDIIKINRKINNWNNKDKNKNNYYEVIIYNTPKYQEKQTKLF